MKRRLVILCVDDDPDWREVIIPRILGDGYEIVTASTSREALAFLDDDPPDLLLTDLMLIGSVMDGLRLFREAARRGIRALTLSSFPSLAPADVGVVDKGHVRELRAAVQHSFALA